MNDDSSDSLDQLLGDWAASRAADEEHARQLSNQILAAARGPTGQVAAGSATDAADRLVQRPLNRAGGAIERQFFRLSFNALELRFDHELV